MGRKDTAPKPLSDYYTMYWAALRYQNRSDATLESYRDVLGQFLAYVRQTFGREPTLHDLTVQAVQGYVQHMRTRPLFENNPFKPAYVRQRRVSEFTVEKHVRALKSFASWLAAEGYTSYHVLERLPLPKTPQRVTEPLTEEEIQRIFEVIDTRTKVGCRNYAMILLMLDTGIRAGELVSLVEANVHLDQEPGWIKVCGKGDKERIVTLGKRTHKALLSYRMFARNEGCDRFFVGYRGEPLNVGAVGQVVRRLARAANVPRLHAHLLRHTAATQYLVAGGDAISLQHKLGHTTLTMTSRYVHLAKQQLAAIRERVSPMDHIRLKSPRQSRRARQPKR